MSDLSAPGSVLEYSDATQVQFETEIKPLGQPAILRGVFGEPTPALLSHLKKLLGAPLLR